MSYVQKASPVEVGRLILGGEAIINDERLAWQKTGIRNKDSGFEGLRGPQTDYNVCGRCEGPDLLFCRIAYLVPDAIV